MDNVKIYLGSDDQRHHLRPADLDRFDPLCDSFNVRTVRRETGDEDRQCMRRGARTGEHG